MIKACHHWLYDTFFNFYIHRILKKDFHSINIYGEWDAAGDNSQLIIGNHVSWWDGFWVYYLNKRLLKKQFHAMMLEEELKARRFLSKIGCFSVHPGKRSVVESLNYAVELLQEPGNLVLLYPQGRIASFSAGVLPFEPGIEYIAKKSGIKQVLFYVALVDYFSNRKPVLSLYLGKGEWNESTETSIENQFAEFYSDAKLKQSKCAF
ncbi:lysophospholipid acyltransferase family protein [Alkalitalea saponilacus]|uniref:Acyltransferase n=1 Tax=Alkalitalea saponilacus TaxID=889453 RepID=A0A1T5CF61_9BACT|nr:lysophospholipid acyltransferase family protein [Alkalitalea saponilacus]ASB49846.1 glycerol acyltransferase [Alkalitalea saponilacus]SKB57983.1 Acyltransferase [Alkalitalea saponilacus]